MLFGQGEYGRHIMEGFKPQPDMEYLEQIPKANGIYSGYIVDGMRNGPGTWVPKGADKRYEGFWANDHFCVGKGQLEFNDGTVQIGRFVNGKFRPQVSAPITEKKEVKLTW